MMTLVSQHRIPAVAFFILGAVFLALAAFAGMADFSAEAASSSLPTPSAATVEHEGSFTLSGGIGDLP